MTWIFQCYYGGKLAFNYGTNNCGNIPYVFIENIQNHFLVKGYSHYYQRICISHIGWCFVAKALLSPGAGCVDIISKASHVQPVGPPDGSVGSSGTTAPHRADDYVTFFYYQALVVHADARGEKRHQVQR